MALRTPKQLVIETPPPPPPLDPSSVGGDRPTGHLRKGGRERGEDRESNLFKSHFPNDVMLDSPPPPLRVFPRSRNRTIRLPIV